MLSEDIKAATDNLIDLCQQEGISCGVFLLYPDMENGADVFSGSGALVGYIIERLFTDEKFSEYAEMFYETLMEDFEDGVTFQ